MVGAMLLVAKDPYWSQMSSILDPTRDYNLTSETGRLNLWKRGLGYMLDRPVFGVGASNFPVAEGVLSPLADRQQYGLGVRWMEPHNSFLQVAAELGLPGLVIFLALLVSTFRVLGRVARGAAGGFDDHPEPRSLAQALTASVAGFVVGAMFLSLAYLPMLYTLMAITAALAKVTRYPARPGPTVGRRQRAPPR